MDPAKGPQPPILDDRRPPRLGAVPPARLGCAADLLCTKKVALPTDEGFLLRDPEVNARIKAAFEDEGADCWYFDGAKERFLGDKYNADEWEQVFDVLDVWFDSGSTHAFVLRDREDGAPKTASLTSTWKAPTSTVAGSTARCLQACGTKGRAPYRNVVTHGFTLDEKGNKMSKSLGNTIVPEKVVKQYGADILRLWVAQTDYTADQRIGPEILKGVADSYRRLRNTMRYMLGVAVGFHRSADRLIRRICRSWSAGCCTVWRSSIIRCARAMRSSTSRAWFLAVFNFATVDLSAFYFDIRKDALYCDGDTLNTRRARRARCWTSCSTV